MNGITLTEPKNLIKITKLKSNLSRLQTKDLITRYIIFEYCCLGENIETDEQYVQFVNELSEQEIYKHLSKLIPKSYSQLLSEFRKNSKVIVDKMLKHQLGEGHSYVEPMFRKKKRNTQSHRHSEEKWEHISDIKQYILENAEYKIFLFIADSGIGKTTFLRWLNKYILDSSEEKVPIYISSGDLSTPDWSDKLAKELKRTEREADSTFSKSFLDDDEEIKSFIKISEQNKNLVLLIDGLNESRSSNFDKNVKDNFTDNTKILVTREEYIGEFERQNQNVPIQKIYISPFTTKNIAEYLGKNYNKLKVKIDENKKLFQIPIVLRFACDIYKSKGKFDFKNKFDLYNQIIEEVKESQGGKASETNSVSFNELIEILPYISFKALSKGIIKRIYEKGKHKHFLAQTCEECSILNPYLQNVKGVMDAFKTHDSIFGIFTHQESIFEYYHQSFQEYFTACYLQEQAIDEIKKYLYNPLFSEVLIFLGGALSTLKLKSLIEFLIDEVHEDSEKKIIKELTWQNIAIASWLIVEANEKEIMIDFFWDKLEGADIFFKEYLNSTFHYNKIVNIIGSLYGIIFSDMGIISDEYFHKKTLDLSIRKKNKTELIQEVATYLQEDFEIGFCTIEFIEDNLLGTDKAKKIIKNEVMEHLCNEDIDVSMGGIHKAIKHGLLNDIEVNKIMKNVVIEKLIDEDSWIHDQSIYNSVYVWLANNPDEKKRLRDYIIEMLIILIGFDHIDYIGDIKSKMFLNNFEIEERLNGDVEDDWHYHDLERQSVLNSFDAKEILKNSLIERLIDENGWVHEILIYNVMKYDSEVKKALKAYIINNLCDEDSEFHIEGFDCAVKFGFQNNSEVKGKLRATVIKDLCDKEYWIRRRAIDVVITSGLKNNHEVKEKLKVAVSRDLCDKEYWIREDAIEMTIKLDLQNNHEVKEKLKVAVINNLCGADNWTRDDAISVAIKLGLQNDHEVKEKLKVAIVEEFCNEDSGFRIGEIDMNLKQGLLNDPELKELLKNAIIKDLHKGYCFAVENVIKFGLLNNSKVKEALKNSIIKNLRDGNWLAMNDVIEFKLQNDSEVKEALKSDFIIKSLFNEAYIECEDIIDLAIKLDLTGSIKNKLLEIIKNDDDINFRLKSNFLISLEKLDLESEKIDMCNPQ